MNTIRKFLDSSVIRYLFFGVCTTLVNLILYNVLRSVTSLPIVVCNVISITCAIIFAYVTNAKYVFDSEAQGAKEKWQEFIRFFTARLSTMVIEIGSVEICVLIGMNDRIGKFVSQFVVLVLNYIFSRFLVFRKKK